MQSYFHQIFPNQLARLKFQQPSKFLVSYYADKQLAFFGGRAWERVAEDLAKVEATDRERFVFCLFMITLTDQCVFSHFRTSYPQWRERTWFPKFGWTGLGSHHENPFYLLWSPEKHGCIDIEIMLENMPEYVGFFIAELTAYFSSNELSIEPTAFLKTIVKDKAFSFSEGRIATTFKEQLAAWMGKVDSDK